MPDLTMAGAYGAMIAPDTLRIQRLLPGPVERIWSYLTDSALRRQWLAAGDMTLAPGEPFTLVWRNDELTDPPGTRPDGFGAEHSLDCRIVQADAPRVLTFSWGAQAEVEITLEPRGEEVLLTLTHRRLADRAQSLMVGAGWHAHLDILVAKASGKPARPFWESWVKLRREYEERVPA